MIKRLLIPGLAIGALTISAGSAVAGSFTLDSFNNTKDGNSQAVRSTRFVPNPPNNTQIDLLGVLGGSRQLQINSTTTLPGTNPLSRTTIQVTPSNGELSISNGTSVTSATTSRYDANGVGLNNTFDSQGNSLGNWLTGQYGIDFFAVKVTSLDLTMNITLRLGFADGSVGTVTRNVARQGSDIVVQNNPALPGVPENYYPGNYALFSLTEFLGQSGISLADFQSVSFAELKFTGAFAYDGSIDFIQGIEIPEPSLALATILVAGLGLASTRVRSKPPLDTEDELDKN